jgi:hypothetical protein
MDRKEKYGRASESLAFNGRTYVVLQRAMRVSQSLEKNCCRCKIESREMSMCLARISRFNPEN